MYIFCTLTLGHQRRWLLRLPIYYYCYYIMLYTYNYYTDIYFTLQKPKCSAAAVPLPTTLPPANHSVPGDGGGEAFLWRRRRAPLSQVAAAAVAAASSSSSTRRHASSDQCVRRRSYGDYIGDATDPVGHRQSVYLRALVRIQVRLSMSRYYIIFIKRKNYNKYE